MLLINCNDFFIQIAINTFFELKLFSYNFLNCNYDKFYLYFIGINSIITLFNYSFIYALMDYLMVYVSERICPLFLERFHLSVRTHQKYVHINNYFDLVPLKFSYIYCRFQL